METVKNTENMKKLVKFIGEVGPLVAFFLIYKKYDLIFATQILIFTTFIAVAITYIYEKKIPIMPLVSCLVLGFFGGLTILVQDEIFIKIKPTIVNIIFALVLFSGFFTKKGLLKYLLSSAINMKDQDWLKLSIRFGFFFLFLAILNEIIWRNFNTDFWVKFKVFGMLPISMVFTAAQIPFMLKHGDNKANIKNISKK